MPAESTFVTLRRLFSWFETKPDRLPLHIQRMVERLGVACVPLLSRELCAGQTDQQDVARTALLGLANDRHIRQRIVRELRKIADSNAPDRGKVAALGLLMELGERGTVRFADPGAVQRSSAAAFAAQLDSPAEIAVAAEMIAHELSEEATISLVSVMVQAAPERACGLALELCSRHDVAPRLRERVAEVALLDRVRVATAASQRTPRATRVTVLESNDATAREAEASTRGSRIVVIATRKIAGQRRWRRWAVLIGAQTHIDDCIHEDSSTDADTTLFIARLVAEGYVITSTEFGYARRVIAHAARHTVAHTATSGDLPSPYYLGRDLLDLGNAHLARAPIDPVSSTLGRAIELIVDNDVPRARSLLAYCDGTSADVTAALAACLLAEGQYAAAAEQLTRAIDAEAAWPLHHWNLSVALYQLGDFAGCYRAIARFLATSAEPSGLDADPDQLGRVARAHQLLLKLERSLQLSQTRGQSSPCALKLLSAQGPSNRRA